MTPRLLPDVALLEALLAAARAGGELASLRAEVLARMSRAPAPIAPIVHLPVRL